MVVGELRRYCSDCGTSQRTKMRTDRASAFAPEWDRCHDCGGHAVRYVASAPFSPRRILGNMIWRVASVLYRAGAKISNG